MGADDLPMIMDLRVPPRGAGAGGENRTRDIQLGKLTFYL